MFRAKTIKTVLQHYQALEINIVQILHPQSSLDKDQVCVLVYSIVHFVLLKQIAEFVHVQLVEGIKLLSCWPLVPLHPDWPANCREVKRCRRTTHAQSVYFMQFGQFEAIWGLFYLWKKGLAYIRAPCQPVSEGHSSVTVAMCDWATFLSVSTRPINLLLFISRVLYSHQLGDMRCFHPNQWLVGKYTSRGADKKSKAAHWLHIASCHSPTVLMGFL